MLGMINFLIIPIEVAWEPDYSYSIVYIVFDYIVDFIFLTDLFINFRTSKMHKGEEVTNPIKIARIYLTRPSFYLDVLCIIQLHIITGNSVLKLFKVAKIHTISKFTILLRNINLKQEISALVKIVWYFWLFLMYIHFLACIWFLVVKSRGTWIPPLDYVDYTSVKYFTGESNYQYIMSYYYMVVCFGGNELGPVEPIQFGFISTFMLCASILNALIFGEMSFLATIISEKEQAFY